MVGDTYDLFCHECGLKNELNKKFCSNCGANMVPLTPRSASLIKSEV